LGRKAESGAESPLWKAESRAVDLPGPYFLSIFFRFDLSVFKVFKVLQKCFNKDLLVFLALRLFWLLLKNG
jgi:hypothetical protein